MISTRYVSFIFGILIASSTWGFSLYLYSKLNYNDSNVNPTLFMSNIPKTFTESTFDLHLKKKQKHNYIYKINKDLKSRNYKNSNNVLNQLKPIAFKTIVSVREGLDELGMIKNIEEKKKREEGYKKYAFNVLVSDILSLDRHIPDTRHKLCKNQTYDYKLLNASIIMCFYNEHYNTLLRSLNSIMNRTPKHLLHEIILINDYSVSEELHKQVKKYVKENFSDNVKYYKTERREGLIRARIFGANKATGSVLVFLDSHIEVNKMWIQPLLSRIAFSKTIVPMPVIDIINADTFQYSSSPLVRGGFNWGLHFKWDNLPVGTLLQEQDFIKPIKSPTMAGGLFAMDRQYFFNLGAYDSGMDIWGGENLEISFRIWMCGGSLELIPCSRVGHVFRRRRPYGGSDEQDTMLKNSLRVAHVWMDKYKNYFIRNIKKVHYGDISERQRLREKLKCNDFTWYLENIYPELTLPDDNVELIKSKWNKIEQKFIQPWHSRKRNYINEYQIRLSNTILCIQSEKDIKTKGSKLILSTCSDIKTQMWHETDKKELILGQIFCLEGSDKIPRVNKCHEMGGAQEWKHNGSVRTSIYNVATGACLAVADPHENMHITMDFCSKKDKRSISWDLISSNLSMESFRPSLHNKYFLN